MSIPKIEVVLSPALIPYYDFEGKIAVVIDILRATTTICEALQNGAKAIIPVATVEDAMAYKNTECIVAAERNGYKIEGFDMGNSPQEYLPEIIKNKTIALTTTNGTHALLSSQAADEILIGSFFNLSILSEYLISSKKEVVLVCAGWKNKYNLEDTIFAGAVTHEVQQYFNIDSDAVLSSLLLYEIAIKENNLKGFLEKSNHAQRFDAMGVFDLDFCLEINKTPLIPEFVNNKITRKALAKRL